ncbi:MAG: hypothetical protein AVDCRST_MAG16-774, partial [uncultured Frankineae bacterium]
DRPTDDELAAPVRARPRRRRHRPGPVRDRRLADRHAGAGPGLPAGGGAAAVPAGPLGGLARGPLPGPGRRRAAAARRGDGGAGRDDPAGL